MHLRLKIKKDALPTQTRPQSWSMAFSHGVQKTLLPDGGDWVTELAFSPPPHLREYMYFSFIYIYILSLFLTIIISY